MYTMYTLNVHYVHTNVHMYTMYTLNVHYVHSNVHLYTLMYTMYTLTYTINLHNHTLTYTFIHSKVHFHTHTYTHINFNMDKKTIAILIPSRCCRFKEKNDTNLLYLWHLDEKRNIASAILSLRRFNRVESGNEWRVVTWLVNLNLHNRLLLCTD